MNQPIPIPLAITAALDAYERRRRTLRLARSVGEAAVIGAGAMVVIGAIDQVLHPGIGIRTALCVSGWIAVVGAVTWRGVMPWVQRRDPVTTARAIEAALGGTLSERLSSALELARNPPAGTSAWMIGRTVALAAQDAVTLDPVTLAPATLARRALIAACLCSAVIGTACLVPSLRALVVRSIWPFGHTMRPSACVLVVKPGDATVPQGGHFSLSVEAKPDPKSGLVELTWDDGVVEQLALLCAAPGHFELDLPAVTQGFHYRIFAGDGESQLHRVQVSPPPLLSGISLRIRPPSYTGLPARHEVGGDAEVVAGSIVSIETLFSGAVVASAALLRDGQGEVALHLAEGGAGGAVEVRPDASMSYGLRLIGENGLMAEPPQRWLLTVRPDAPPTGKLSGAGLEAGLIGLDEAMVITASGEDDLGLRRLDLVISDDAGELARRPLLAQSSAAWPRSLTRRELVELQEFDFGPGDHIAVYLDAEDLGGQKSASNVLELAVIEGDPARAAAWAAQLRTRLDELNTQLDVLRQVEKSWLSLMRSYRSEDPTAQRGEVGLLGARMVEAAQRVASLSHDVRQQALDSALSSAPRVQAVVDDLAMWASLQNSILNKAVSAAREPGATVEALVRCRDLTESAHRGLTALREDFGLVVARLEGEGLVGACMAAQQRGRRASQVLNGHFAWANPDLQPGLLLTVFAGVGVEGEILKTGPAAVTIAEALPVNRPENWSARWQGEIKIEQEGDYEFIAASDDGVRVRVAAQDLFPGAWITQATTEYRGRVHLAAGWQSITVDYFQGAAIAALQLSYGVVGGPVTPVDRSNTRCVGSVSDDPATIAAMVETSPAAVTRARLRLTSAQMTAAAVPETIDRMASDSGREGLVALANQGRGEAKAGRDLAAKPEAITAKDLQPMNQRLDTMLDLARKALAVLDQAVARERLKPDGPLGAERGIVAEMRARAAALRRLPGNTPAADREAALRREVAAARAANDTLADRLAERQDELVSRAVTPAATLAERAAALLAREALVTEVGAAQRQLTAALAQPPGDSNAFADRLEQNAQHLDKILGETAGQVERADKAAARSVATDLRQHAAAAAVAEKAGDMAKADHERVAAAALGAAEATRMRDRGNTAAAGVLEKALATNDAEAAAKAIERDAGPQREAARLDEIAAKQLGRVAAELQQGPPRPADIADLNAAAVALSLESERRRVDSEAGKESAAAFANLAADAHAATVGQPDPAEVADLAKRAERLRGDDAQARHNEAAIAQERNLESSQASAIADAADKASTEAGAKNREAVTKQLEDLAGGAAAAAPPSATEREATAERLMELADRDAALSAQEAAARAEFAKSQSAVASAASAAADAAKAAAAAAGANDALSKALGTTAERLPVVAAEAQQRAALAAQGMPGDSAKDPSGSARLVAETAAAAAQLTQNVARPLALAARATSDAAARQQAGAVSAQLADVADAQQRAAERLARALERREANRVALAQELAAADLSDAGNPVSAEALAAAAQAQAARTAADSAATAARLAAERAQADQTQTVAAAQARAAAVQANDAAVDAAGKAMAALPSESAAAHTRALGALSTAARQGRDLAADLAPNDASASAQVGQQAAAAHQAMAEASAGLADQARAAAATLRGATPATTTPAASAVQTAAAQALAAVRAAPSSPASWQHAADTMSAAAAHEATATSSAAANAAHNSAAKSAAKSAAEPSAASQSSSSGASPTASGSGKGDPGDAKGMEQPTAAIDQAEWGRSRGDLRGDIMAGGVESFSEEHQEAIRAYFKRLGSDQ